MKLIIYVHYRGMSAADDDMKVQFSWESSGLPSGRTRLQTYVGRTNNQGVKNLVTSRWL